MLCRLYNFTAQIFLYMAKKIRNSGGLISLHIIFIIIFLIIFIFSNFTISFNSIKYKLYIYY